MSPGGLAADSRKHAASVRPKHRRASDRYRDRMSETELSPDVAVSQDPAKDGRTKLIGWGLAIVGVLVAGGIFLFGGGSDNPPMSADAKATNACEAFVKTGLKSSSSEQFSAESVSRHG